MHWRCAADACSPDCCSTHSNSLQLRYVISTNSNPPSTLVPGKWGEVSRDIRRVLERFRQVRHHCRFFPCLPQTLTCPNVGVQWGCKHAVAARVAW